MVFQCEKALKDFGDKVTEEDKAPIEAKLNDLKEALKSDNTEDIKAKTDALQQAFYALSEKVYKAAGAQAGAADGAAAGGAADFNENKDGSFDGDVVDTDYTEV